MSAKRRLAALARVVDERRAHQQRSREWTNAGAVHQEPEHVLEVLRVLDDAGALAEVLNRAGLDAAALGVVEP